jgi:hypothetical protein
MNTTGNLECRKSLEGRHAENCNKILNWILQKHDVDWIHLAQDTRNQERTPVNTIINLTWSEVLSATSMKMAVSWDEAPCSLVDIDRRFAGVHFLIIRGGGKLLWNVGQYLSDYTFCIPKDSHLHDNELRGSINMLNVSNSYDTMRFTVCLDSQVVIVLANGPKVCGFKPAEDDGFLTVIKIRSTTSFGGEIKPSASCRKILWYGEEHWGVWKGYFVGKMHSHFSLSFSLFTIKYLCWYLPESSGG